MIIKMPYKLVPVPEVIYFQEGPGLRKWQYSNSGIPFLNIRTIGDDGSIIKELCNCVTEEEVEKKYKHFLLNEGDLVVSSSGTLGKLAVVRENDLPLMLNTSVIRFRSLDNNFLLQSYLKWFIKSPFYLWQIKKASTGTAIKNYGPSHLKKMFIPVPPIPKQRRIAAILDKANAIRRKRQEAIRLMEEFLHSAFLDIVGPGASNYEKWPEDTIEGLALDKKNSMRTGPFGSDLRHSEFIDKGIAVLGIDNAVKNYFDWGERRFITPEKYEKLKRYKIFPGDVIITIMGTTGCSAVIPDDIPLAITTKHLAAITLNRKLAHPEFIAYAIHDHPEILHQIEKAQRGAIMNGLNLTLIKELRLRVPPLPIQEHFASIVHKVRQTLNKLSQANECGAEDLFNSLVQRAFRGELAHTEDELAQQEGRPYGSASVLLSKIKALGKDL